MHSFYHKLLFHSFINNEELRIDIAEVRKLHPGLLTFDEWLQNIGKPKIELLLA